VPAPPHFGCGGRARPRVPSETGNDHKNLLHACRRHLCPDRASAVDPDCDGVVRHLEWRRCAVLGELDCRRRGGHVELRRLPRRHVQLKAGRARPGRSVAGQWSHFPTRGHRAVALYCDSGLVQYMFLRPQYFAPWQRRFIGRGDFRCGSFSEVSIRTGKVRFALMSGLRQSGPSGPKSANC